MATAGFQDLGGGVATWRLQHPRRRFNARSRRPRRHQPTALILAKYPEFRAPPMGERLISTRTDAPAVSQPDSQDEGSGMPPFMVIGIGRSATGSNVTDGTVRPVQSVNSISTAGFGLSKVCMIVPTAPRPRFVGQGIDERNSVQDRYGRQASDPLRHGVLMFAFWSPVRNIGAIHYRYGDEWRERNTQLARRTPCKLDDPQPPDLLIQCRRSALIDALDFIHGRFWDVVGKPFQSITGGGTLQPSGSTGDTDGGGTECAQTFWLVLARGWSSSSATRWPPNSGPGFRRR
jgi:hypothetical protein